MLKLFLIACEFSVRSCTRWHVPFRWVTCVDDEAAHCTSLRPNSTLSPHYSAYGLGNAHGVVIYIVQFCHQNVSGAITNSARRCFYLFQALHLVACTISSTIHVRIHVQIVSSDHHSPCTTNESWFSDNSVDIPHEHVPEGLAISFADCDQRIASVEGVVRA